MHIEEAIETHLKGTTGLTDLVSQRVYDLGAVPGSPTLPYVVYSKTSGLRDQTHDGASGLANPHFDISSYDDSYTGSKDVAVQVQQAVQGFSGTMGGGGGVSVGSFLYVDEVDSYDSANSLYQVSAEYAVWHEE
jgi:hypothetical protein